MASTPSHDPEGFDSGVKELDLPLDFHGRRGRVKVRLGPVVDPARVGQTPDARGFPVCIAALEFGASGYDAFFGWVQLVRSTDTGAGEFEMDPLYFFRDNPSPYAFYGLLPTLFDAPWRATHREIHWTAHSFLATTPLEEPMNVDLANRRVVPLAGFEWGFDIDPEGTFHIRGPTSLASSDWTRHVAFLRTQFPTWKFEPSFESDPR